MEFPMNTECYTSNLRKSLPHVYIDSQRELMTQHIPALQTSTPPQPNPTHQHQHQHANTSTHRHVFLTLLALSWPSYGELFVPIASPAQASDFLLA